MTLALNTELDVAALGLRQVNRALKATESGQFVVRNPKGAHALACGLQHPVEIEIDGPVGYYAAGMNQRAQITIHGNAGTGVAENMMSGTVRVRGNASQSAGATAHGGLLVIEGHASARCGISMKGVDIVVGGSVGHMAAFMGQAGRMVVLGDAGEGFGDSLYEARLYVRGTVAALGADCIAKEMREEHHSELAQLLTRAGLDADPSAFTRYGSARRLYNFEIDDPNAPEEPR
ncbi:MAG: protein glxC [Pseudomonadota bacterium]